MAVPKLPPSNMSSDHLEFRAMITPPLIRSWPFFSQSSREGWMFFSHLSSYGSMRWRKNPWNVHLARHLSPIGSMNGIFTCIYHKKSTINVGKHTIFPWMVWVIFDHHLLIRVDRAKPKTTTFGLMYVTIRSKPRFWCLKKPKNATVSPSISKFQTLVIHGNSKKQPSVKCTRSTSFFTMEKNGTTISSWCPHWSKTHRHFAAASAARCHREYPPVPKWATWQPFLWEPEALRVNPQNAPQPPERDKALKKGGILKGSWWWSQPFYVGTSTHQEPKPALFPVVFEGSKVKKRPNDKNI